LAAEVTATLRPDIRASVAQYYDLMPEPPKDVPFYERLLSSPDATVLELGCGTGRVLLPLAERCGFIQGIDSSEAMLDICRRKLGAARVPPQKARIACADITDLQLGQRFDLIIAPFRVMQNLERDRHVDGLFAGIERHLSRGGSCVLNVFRPNLPAEDLRQRWVTQGETFQWEVPVDGGRVTCHDRRPSLNADPLILYPELIWRRYEAQRLVDEARLRIAMRCYYPDEFSRLIGAHRFRVLHRWGGYAGEAYGEGPELVVQFGR
jgi:SAM-dependent methyltransferase